MMATKESENFYRLVSLLVDIGTASIRRLFLKYAVNPPAVTSVTQFLVQEQNTINSLSTKRVLGPAQLKLLQPPPGQVADPETWDISLLCILLKNTCPITQTERNDIDVIRNIRNQIYGHRASAALSETDFTQNWSDIETASKSIAHACNDVAFENYLAKYIDRVKLGALDIESTTQIFKQWFKDDDDVKAQLDTVSDTLDHVSAKIKDLSAKPITVDHIFENLKEQTATILKYKCSQPFVFTTQFNEAKSILEREGCVTISGKPGEGKTLAAYRLIESIGTQGRSVCLYEPSHWDHVDTNEVDIILLDDIFGKHQLDLGKLESWRPVLEVLEAYVHAGKLKVILTSRQNVLAQAKNNLRELSVVKHRTELSSSELTTAERIRMLDTLLEFNQRDKSEINVKKCCDVYKAEIGFPYCAFLFATDKSLFDRGDRFFRRPYQFFKETLGALSKEIKASLLFLFYARGQCSDKDLKSSIKKKDSVKINENEDILSRISDLIGINDQEMSLSVVRTTLEDLSSMYVTHLNKTVSFSHNVVYECVALIHGERYPEEVIENCTWNFITGCVVTTKKEDEAKLTIDSDVYESLSTRFLQETLGTNTDMSRFYDIRSHKVMQTHVFCARFFEILFTRSELRQFLTKEMNENQHGFLYKYLTSKSEDETAYLLEEAIPYLKCTCMVENVTQCWKCHVKNDAARGACFGGDKSSYSLLLQEGITVRPRSIHDACTGENPELLKLVISTLKNKKIFNPEEVSAIKSLVIAHRSKQSTLYTILRDEGIKVMPLCVYDAVVCKDLTMVQHFVRELKINNAWDINDFWLQHALQESVSNNLPEICHFLKEEGLGYHRGCLLAAVKSKQLIKVKEIVEGMKLLGTWQSADWSFERALKGISSAFQTGNLTPLNIPALADVGVSEALVEAKYHDDKSIYEYLRTEGVQLTMEALPHIVATKELDYVKGVVMELKDQGRWSPVGRSCDEAITKAFQLQCTDIFDFLVAEGITCTMNMLSLYMAAANITVEEIAEIVTLIKRFGNWNSDDVSIQLALTEAFKMDDKSVFNYLIQTGAKINTASVLTAVFAQDTNTVDMFLQILKSSPRWDPSDQILNMCMQLSKLASPEIYNLLLDAGVGYSSRSLVAAAVQNDSIAMMMTVNELIDSKNWEPKTDSNIATALEFVCRHNNMPMYNVIRKKGASLTMNGIFNIIGNCKSLLYSIGPEYRKEVKDVPSLAAMTTASLARKVLIPATRQKAVFIYIRIIHALEETGKLDRNDPLLQEALNAAVDAGSALAYNTIADTGAEVTENVVLRILETVDKDLKIEVPERLLNRVYRMCVMQCLLACIMKGNLNALEKVSLLMKRNMLWCPDDQRILQARTMTKSANKSEISQKLFEVKFTEIK